MNRVRITAALAMIELLSREAFADSAPSKRVNSVELGRSPNATCDLAADDRFLYWTTVDHNFDRPADGRAGQGSGGRGIDWRYERATIQRLPKSGGPPETFVEVKGDRLFNLNLDQNQIFWNGQHHDDLWRVAKTGGTPVRVDDGKWRVFGTVQDAQNLYVRDQSRPPAGLLRIPKSSGPTTIVVQSRTLAIVLGVDRGWLYWGERLVSESRDGWALRATSMVGGPTRNVEGFVENTTEFVFDDAAYFVTNRAAYRLDRLAQKVRRLAGATEYGDRGSIAVDSKFLYWAEGNAGQIMRVPKQGGAATVAASGGEPCAVVASGDNIFWIDRRGNRIMRTSL